MAYNPPTYGESGEVYTDNVRNSLAHVKSAAEAAQATADNAVASIVNTAQTADEALEKAAAAQAFVQSPTDDRIAGLVEDAASATSAALSATFEQTLTPTGGDDTTLISTALASASVVLRGAFTVASTITVPSGRTIRGVGAAVTWTGSTAAEAAILNVSNADHITVMGIKFEASGDTNNIVAVRGGKCSHITVENCSGNTRLIETNAASTATTYASVTPTDRSHHITVVGNRMKGTTGASTAGCITFLYTDDWIATDNHVDTYNHGIMWWGGDSNFNADGAWGNERKCVRGVTHGNIVRNVVQGGIWGSMGRSLVLGPDTVENCGDVGIDLEGCYDSVVNVGAIKDCTSGGLATFFNCRSITFQGGSVTSSDPSFLLARLISNFSMNADNVSDVVYDGVTFRCLSGIGSVSVSGPASRMLYRNNHHENVTLNLADGYWRTPVVEGNYFNFTVALSAAGSLVSLPPVASGHQEINRNTIRSTVTQPAGTVGLDVNNNDYNSSPTGRVTGNHVAGVPVPIKLRWSGGNAGTVARYAVVDNLADSIVMDTTGAANPAVVIAESGNLNHSMAAITVT